MRAILRTIVAITLGLSAALAGRAPALLAAPQQGPGQQASAPLGSFHELAQRRLPAVVSVMASHEAAQGGGRQLQGNLPPAVEEFLKRFFGPDALQQFGRGVPQQPSPPAQALGSGFIVDPSGYIVTNNHVVSGADSVTVMLLDDTELTAKVVGTDPQTDLALLKVETERELPYLEWGDSNRQARVGDWVVAIGNPFGLGGTVTAGIVSARARNIEAGPYDDFIQTDAAINRGNSGGPLIAVGGRVVGVNTAIFSPTGGNIGIGFAVPASVAQPVVKQLRETGQVRRGWLGVQIQPVTKGLAEAMGLDQARGAMVAGVNEGSPAAEVGIKVGDIILRFADRKIDDVRELARAVAEHPVGKTAEVIVWRDGQRVELSPKIALLRQASPQVAQRQQGESHGADETGKLGMTLAPLTTQQRQVLGLAESVRGAMITGIEAGGAAAREGVRPGDVITRVGNKPIDSPSAVVEAIRDARANDKQSVAILLQRGEQKRFVALPLATERG